MSNQKLFVDKLNEFVAFIETLNFFKTDNSNIVYSFGMTKINSVLNSKIRKEIFNLIAAFKTSDIKKINKISSTLDGMFLSSYSIGDISEDNLRKLKRMLKELVNIYNKGR